MEYNNSQTVSNCVHQLQVLALHTGGSSPYRNQHTESSNKRKVKDQLVPNRIIVCQLLLWQGLGKQILGCQAITRGGHDSLVYLLSLHLQLGSNFRPWVLDHTVERALTLDSQPEVGWVWVESGQNHLDIDWAAWIEFLIAWSSPVLQLDHLIFDPSCGCQYSKYFSDYPLLHAKCVQTKPPISTTGSIHSD